MDWFRHYHGLCTDPKLHRVAVAARVRRSVVIAAWCAVLEIADRGKPHGSVDLLDAAVLSFMIDASARLAGRIITGLRDEGLIVDNAITYWRDHEIGRRPAASEWAELRRIVFERDNYTCSYCGSRGGKLECDHKLPVSRGGSHGLDNLTTAYFDCNRSKRAKTVDEWLGEVS